MKEIDADRRNLLKGAVATSLASLAGNFSLNSAHAAKADPDLIHRENLKEGSTDWQLTRVMLDSRNGFRSSKIEGYCSKQSVAAGEPIDIMVSTRPAQEFKIEIFRTGYY
ncbi:MAG: hypothetical protein RLO18_10370, partial [Gimesia chilikensis]